MTAPRALIAATLLALAGCQSDDPGATADNTGFVPIGEDGLRAVCVLDGGSWAQTPSGGFTCVRTTRDAGQQCRSQNDCEGVCLARSRTCAPVVPFLGCHEVLTASGRQATLCIE